MISMFAEPKWKLKTRKKVAKHWYFIDETYCPQCGRSQAYKERRYTERPEKYEDRHHFEERYDYCDA